MRFAPMGLTLVGTLALGGCEVNRVRSHEALFREADRSGLTLRAGIWATPDAGCVFEPEVSVKSWPDCANGVALPADALNRAITTPGFAVESLLVDGDPLILQTRWGATRPEKPERLLYEYAALKPLARDARGELTSYEIWSVLCAPAEPAARVADNATAPSPAPPAAPRPPEVLPPGVTRDPEDGCLARDPEAVRTAARLTRDNGWTSPRRATWMRKRALRDLFGREPAARH